MAESDKKYIITKGIINFSDMKYIYCHYITPAAYLFSQIKKIITKLYSGWYCNKLNWQNQIKKTI